jgi:hypothetical protein
VKVPPLTLSGQVLRLKGRGATRKGHLYVHVVIGEDVRAGLRF